MSEFIKSDTAIENCICNIPDIKSLDNLLNLIFYCLQPVRELFNKPVIITSGYRCQKLNKLVGGKVNSQHLCGCAADFIIKNIAPSEIIKKIQASNILFDQLINEYNSWVHISYVKDKNRKQVLYYKN